MKFSKAVVKYRVIILVIALAAMIPSLFGYINTRVNYDMLNYLPGDMETIVGQDELMNDFGKGAFSLIILEDMSVRDVSVLKEKIEKVNHVDSVVWYNSIADVSIPMEILPESIYNAFNTDKSTLMAVFFDSSTSADVTNAAFIFNLLYPSALDTPGNNSTNNINNNINLFFIYVQSFLYIFCFDIHCS